MYFNTTSSFQERENENINKGEWAMSMTRIAKQVHGEMRVRSVQVNKVYNSLGKVLLDGINVSSKTSCINL